MFSHKYLSLNGVCITVSCKYSTQFLNLQYFLSLCIVYIVRKRMFPFTYLVKATMYHDITLLQNFLSTHWEFRNGEQDTNLVCVSSFRKKFGSILRQQDHMSKNNLKTLEPYECKQQWLLNLSLFYIKWKRKGKNMQAKKEKVWDKPNSLLAFWSIIFLTHIAWKI